MSHLFADDPAPENQDIHMIVLDTLMRRVRVVTKPGTNTWKLVPCHRGAHSASAYQHSALDSFAQNRRSDRLREVWIIDRSGVARPQIFYAMAQFLEVFANLFL